MAKSSTTFSKDKQPNKGRGKSERTKLLEAMERAGETEEGFYDLLMTKAFNPEDSFTFKELLNRISPIPKSVAPIVQFDFDEKASPHIKADQVLKAMADGKLPSDLGHLFITSIQSMLKIQEVTDIDERLRIMEAQIDAPE